MDQIKRSVTCRTRKTCTGCEFRKECNYRMAFYEIDNFEGDYMKRAEVLTNNDPILMGRYKVLLEALIVKKEEEKRLHPEYVPD